MDVILKLRSKKILTEEEYSQLIKYLGGASIIKDTVDGTEVVGIKDNTGYTTFHIMMEDIIEKAAEGITVPEAGYRIAPVYPNIKRLAIVAEAAFVISGVKASKDAKFVTKYTPKGSEEVKELYTSFDVEKGEITIKVEDSGEGSYVIEGTSEYGNSIMEFSTTLLPFGVKYQGVVTDEKSYDALVPADYREEYPYEDSKDSLPWIVIGFENAPVSSGKRVIITMAPTATYGDGVDKLGTVSEDRSSLDMMAKNYVMFEVIKDLGFEKLPSRLVAVVKEYVEEETPEVPATKYPYVYKYFDTDGNEISPSESVEAEEGTDMRQGKTPKDIQDYQFETIDDNGSAIVTSDESQNFTTFIYSKVKYVKVILKENSAYLHPDELVSELLKGKDYKVGDTLQFGLAPGTVTIDLGTTTLFSDKHPQGLEVGSDKYSQEITYEITEEDGDTIRIECSGIDVPQDVIVYIEYLDSDTNDQIKDSSELNELEGNLIITNNHKVDIEGYVFDYCNEGGTYIVPQGGGNISYYYKKL